MCVCLFSLGLFYYKVLFFLYRNFPSPFQSWYSPRPAGALMESSTQVRRERFSSDGEPRRSVPVCVSYEPVHRFEKVSAPFWYCAGKKQDTWFVVDPQTGEKQTSLSTTSSDSICPSAPLLYIGRTGTSIVRLSRTYNHVSWVRKGIYLSLSFQITYHR